MATTLKRQKPDSLTLVPASRHTLRKSVEAKTFDAPDDTVTFDHGHVELVTVGSITIGREVLEPTFDAPARAIRYALRLAEASRKLGIEIRAGVHTDEVEFADQDLHGLAVHLAARIMAAAEQGTTYVSATTRELTIGAGLESAGRGTRAFKGISGEREIFEARLSTPTARS